MNLADRALKAALSWFRNDRSPTPDIAALKVRIYEIAWKHGYEAATRDARHERKSK